MELQDTKINRTTNGDTIRRCKSLHIWSFEECTIEQMVGSTLRGTVKNKPFSITGRVASCTMVIFSYPASLIPFNENGDTEH